DKVHAPYEGCDSCHKPHASAQPRLLAEPVRQLCEGCHDTKSEGARKAHLAIDPAKMDCVSCHTPHVSKSDKMFKKNVHPPFAARQCDACHQAEKG
ncbi:MAG TPA: cytochrome c3 family protein, partial [Anaeromyxobacteraceae bacterium]|nr:cytochrome c3 family protein [Anaeromyxobacteraceae bacterium]